MLHGSCTAGQRDGRGGEAVITGRSLFGLCDVALGFVGGGAIVLAVFDGKKYNHLNVLSWKFATEEPNMQHVGFKERVSCVINNANTYLLQMLF